MSVIQNNLLMTPEGYQISRSVRLRSSASAYFNRTLGAGGGTTKNVFSAWVKRGTLGVQQGIFQGRQDGNNQQYIGFTSGDAIEVGIISGGSQILQKISTSVYRDPSGWYHIFFRQDNTLTSAEDRYQLWVNGVRVTAWSTNTNTASQSTAYFFGSANPHFISSYNGAASYFDGYITEATFVYAPSSSPLVTDFGETDAVTGVWKPKKYAGTYGTNGFYLNFSDNSNNTATTIGKDYSGNGNNWTPNNISVTSGVTYDSMLDVPTPYAEGGNGRGNYAVMNPLDSGASFTPSDGNMRIVLGSSLARTTRATIGVSTGKWYFETVVGGSGAMVGVATASAALSNYTGSDANGWSYYGTDGNKYTGGVNTAYGSTYTANDVIGVALDMDSGKVWFSKNGTWQASGDPAAGTNAAYSTLSGVIFPVLSYANNGGTSYFNAGQRPFAYTPPTGFKALNTQNLPDATIKKGNAYFDATTYTGTGSSQAVVNAGGFQPDLLWYKNRSYSSGASHRLFDSSRGTNALYSNLTNAEANESAYFTSLNSNGFTVTGNDQSSNYSGSTFVGWQWKESATAGFDIVTYTGTGVARTVAHSLGVTPSMIFVKSRSSGTDGWPVYHSSVGNLSALVLNSTGAINTNSVWWNNTSPTSSVFTVGTNSGVNANAATYVAYLFAEVAGFSKFGSYTGNGSSDGPFVFCGFRPRFILFKSSSSGTENWIIHDTSRDTYNQVVNTLAPNTSGAEVAYASSQGIDVLSNGFKIRVSSAPVNTSSGTYIYAAFAENPFKNSLAR